MAVARESERGLLAQLRRALACIASAQPLLAACHAENVENVDGELCTTDFVALLERLHGVRRLLQEALSLAETSAHDEDGLLQVILELYHTALGDRSNADEQCTVEQQRIVGLRMDIAGLRRGILRSGGEQKGKEESLRGDRIKALEQRLAAAQAMANDLRLEADEISQLLSESRSKSEAAGTAIEQLEEGHSVAIMEHCRAREALGSDPTLDSYKRTKQQEWEAADDALLKACTRCEEEMEHCSSSWAAMQAKHCEELQKLQAEARGLQEQMASKQAQSERMLQLQAAEHKQTFDEAEGRFAVEGARLEDQRQQRVMALRQEVAASQKLLREAELGTQRRLETQLREVKLSYWTKAKMEQARWEDGIAAERNAVAQAKLQRKEWERRAEKSRENYRAHAIKSGAYVKGLDLKRRNNLSELWCKG
mmetsp:Transcript_37670/g.82718  ORF Transcript_37670/g.82718 Transcript_37670/m.82718 type:complete len:425 (-) Transcript_37670:72-1346(-)|eukprot:CAMPEP_0170605480 /NCGR_PEP_ID=MMETSP0224-20130122/19996_1 /TAXON_ID=285029 /ORGANISM="Togula jolla, Strain CCCM 725" /LENGTH=424 /DNA_ID=CAMNT_0010930487 /DNA_START=77 /DNA_END=1351 /DNA_ORIENTATION=-